MCPQALDGIRRRLAEFGNLAERKDILLLEKGQHLHPDPGSALSVIHRPVVVVQ